MFDDLHNQSLNKIPTYDAKAYPSVNSPNDGGFNSEENMRWLTKAIANKPFIIGQTDEAVNRSFGETGSAGNGVYTAPGFFSVDGYIGKLAKTKDISFDNTSYETYTTNNTQNVQRFVQGLTGQGTDYAINTTLGSILLTEYNPESENAVVEDVEAAWNKAYIDHTCVGYVWITYTGDYADSIHVVNSPTSETIIGRVYYEFDDSSRKTVNLISDTPTTPFDISFVESLIGDEKIKSGDAFATTVDGNIVIFYPIFFERYSEWDVVKKSYVDKPKLAFEDIYSLVYYYDQETCQSRSYPNTTNTLVDMDSNAPLSSISFSGCNLTTYPNKLYPYVNLYESDGLTSPMYRRKENIVDSDYFVSYESLDDFPAQLENIYSELNPSQTVFTKKTLVQLLENIPSDQTDIDFIHNNLSYYCLNSINNDSQMSDFLLEFNGNKIPVAFMTSEGSLCGSGFVWAYYCSTTEPYLSDGLVGVSKRYPVEGYVHFAKRYYLQAIAGNPAPSEDDIDAVNIGTMLSNSTFMTFYNTYLAEAIGLYLHLTYCSLLDNVIHGEPNYLNDYLLIKSAGCGVKLTEEKGSIVTHDDNNFFTRQEYTIAAYENPGTSSSTTNIPVTISYHNDMSSDANKFTKFVMRNKDYDGAIIPYYEEVPIYELRKFVNTEDPINMIRYCTSTETTANETYLLQRFNLYCIEKQSGSVTYKMSKIGGNTIKLTKNAVVGSYNVSNIYLDDQLIPFRKASLVGDDALNSYTIENEDFFATIRAHIQTSLSSATNTTSFSSGACLSWVSNTWKTAIPYVLNVEKDNLGYLRNIDVTDLGYYFGFKFDYKFPKDVTNDDLFIAYLDLCTTVTIGGYDIESGNKKYDITSKKSKHRRESYIHFNKLYGDNFETFEDGVYKVMSSTISDLERKVKRLEDQTILSIGTCGENITYVLYQNGLVTLSGTGSTYDYTSSSETQSPFYGKTQIKYVSVSEGITKIGDYLFTLCSNLETVVLPESLTIIGDYAFYDTSLIGTVNMGNYTIRPYELRLPANLTTVGQSAFAYTDVEKLSLPFSLADIGSYAFKDCTELKEVNSRCARFGTGTFMNCSKLEIVSMYYEQGSGGVVSSIGSDCFKGCSVLGINGYGIDFRVRSYVLPWDEVAKGTNWDGKEDTPESTPYFTKISSIGYDYNWNESDHEWVYRQKF